MIIGCALVTMIPRIIPFLVVRNITLPESVLKWLSYVPVCVLTALVVKDCMLQSQDFLGLNWPVAVTLDPDSLDRDKNEKLIYYCDQRCPSYGGFAIMGIKQENRHLLDQGRRP